MKDLKMIGTEDVNFCMLSKVTKAFADLKKKAQHESCKLSFTGGKMWGLYSWETAPQIPLWETAAKRQRERSEYRFGWSRSIQQSSTYYIFFADGFASHEEQLSPWRILVVSRWGDTRIGLIKLLPKISIWRYISASFPRAQNTSFLLSTLSL